MTKVSVFRQPLFVFESFFFAFKSMFFFVRVLNVYIRINQIRAATRGGKRGRRPLNKNSAPLKYPACSPKLPFPLR